MSDVAVVVFRSRVRPESRQEYATWAKRMGALALEQPGFVSMKTFAADDGERVTIAEFESVDAARAWGQVPEHLEAQRLGRERFYAEFDLHTCRSVRHLQFKAD